MHDRPNVSKPAREKVEQALKEMNYQPNMYASALAYNKSYTFYLLIPKHESEAYWEEIEEGARKCEETRRDFHIDVEILFYERSSEESFREQGQAVIDAQPEGVIVVPSSLEVTREFTDQLHQKSIPFIMLDSYMPDLRPLSFFGQDSFCSGFFAAKMLMMIANKETEIMLMRQTKNGIVVSKQQDNREVGFRHYMHDHFHRSRSMCSTYRSMAPEVSSTRCWRNISPSTLPLTIASPSPRRLTWWATSS